MTSRTHFVTYGDRNYFISAMRICRQMSRVKWCHSISRYSPRLLNKEFKAKYTNILSESRGGGYWIWKPWLINHCLKKVSNGDFLLYMDAGCTINMKGKSRFYEYLDMVSESRQGILSMQMEHLEKEWTNSATLKHFKINESDEIANSGQLHATFLLLQKRTSSSELVADWLATLEKDPMLFTDYYNKIDPVAGFQDHRHDQSIFSIIRKRSQPMVIPDESWFEDFSSEEASHYPFWSTRLRDSKRMLRKFLLSKV